MSEIIGVNLDAILSHYGRKGMKWGENIYSRVRGHTNRSQAEKQKKIREAVERKKATTKLSKDPTKMTDEELQRAINRARNEQTYKQLFPQKEVSRGRKFVKTLEKKVIVPSLIDGGKQALTAYFSIQFKKKLGVPLEGGGKKKKKGSDISKINITSKDLEAVLAKAKTSKNTKGV